MARRRVVRKSIWKGSFYHRKKSATWRHRSSGRIVRGLSPNANVSLLRRRAGLSREVERELKHKSGRDILLPRQRIQERLASKEATAFRNLRQARRRRR